jgi:hypothetical protein
MVMQSVPGLREQQHRLGGTGAGLVVAVDVGSWTHGSLRSDGLPEILSARDGASAVRNPSHPQLAGSSSGRATMAGTRTRGWLADAEHRRDRVLRADRSSTTTCTPSDWTHRASTTNGYKHFRYDRSASGAWTGPRSHAGTNKRRPDERRAPQCPLRRRS